MLVRIVAASNEIVRVRLVDSAARAVTATPGVEETWPYWSEVARRLVYQTSTDGVWHDLLLWDPDRQGTVAITRSPRRDEEWPAWSPRRPELVFAFRGGAPPSGLVIADAPSRTQRLLAASGKRDFFLRPSFAPDGETLVVQRRDSHASGSNLWRIDPGSAPKPLTEDPAWYDTKPTYTRDGREILFARRPAAGGASDILAIPATGGTPRTLVSRPESNDDTPRPSPCRDELVFVSDRSGLSALYLAPLAGGAARPLSADPTRQFFAPHWSPDGERVVAIATPVRVWQAQALRSQEPGRDARGRIRPRRTHALRRAGLHARLDAAVARALGPARSRAALAALVFALASAVYLPIRGHEWLNYDDDSYVSRNPELQHGMGWEGIRWAFTTQQGANWFPLTRLSWLLDLELHGLDAGGFLLTNLLLHALASALFFLALARLTGNLSCSAFAAAVFAVHPLHVESVAWIAARKDVLSGVFCMLALLAFANAAKAQKARGAKLALFASLALGLLAKPTLVTLPCVLLLLDAWPLGRLARGEKNPDARRLAHALIEKLPLFALAAASCLVTWRAQAAAGVVASFDRLALADRVANALVAYAVYLRQFAWPSRLAVFYPHAGSGLPIWKPLLAAALLLGLTLLALRSWPRRGYLTVGWLWFLGMLVPTIGLVQVGSQAHADRYMYLPLAGLAIALAWGAPGLLGRRDPLGGHGRRRVALAGAGVLVVASLAVATRLQLRHWHDSVALFEHALEVTENNHIAHVQLGAAYAERGRLDETVRHYREAVRVRPDFEKALNNLAWLLATARDPALRDPTDAVRLAERAVALSGASDPAVLDTLAAAYAAAGRFDDAVQVGQRALQAAETRGTPALAEPLRARLALYRERRAYQE